MVNLDVTVATAVGNTFRVYDAFTTGTFRPSPDASYGGQDDILDAVGRQSVDAEGKGMVLIKLRKPLSSKDGDADYCFEEGVLYRLAYAYGQSSPGGRVFHSPPSSLETGTARNAEFYAPNALLYHGGGMRPPDTDGRNAPRAISMMR